MHINSVLRFENGGHFIEAEELTVIDDWRCQGKGTHHPEDENFDMHCFDLLVTGAKSWMTVAESERRVRVVG